MRRSKTIVGIIIGETIGGKRTFLSTSYAVVLGIWLIDFKRAAVNFGPLIDCTHSFVSLKT